MPKVTLMNENVEEGGSGARRRPRRQHRRRMPAPDPGGRGETTTGVRTRRLSKSSVDWDFDSPPRAPSPSPASMLSPPAAAKRNPRGRGSRSDRSRQVRKEMWWMSEHACADLSTLRARAHCSRNATALKWASRFPLPSSHHTHSRVTFGGWRDRGAGTYCRVRCRCSGHRGMPALPRRGRGSTNCTWHLGDCYAIHERMKTTRRKLYCSV